MTPTVGSRWRRGDDVRMVHAIHALKGKHVPKATVISLVHPGGGWDAWSIPVELSRTEVLEDYGWRLVQP